MHLVYQYMLYHISNVVWGHLTIDCVAVGHLTRSLGTLFKVLCMKAARRRLWTPEKISCLLTTLQTKNEAMAEGRMQVM